MKLTKFLCDKCGEEITDIVYTLTCFAAIIPGENPAKYINEAAEQNIRQSRLDGAQRHLCRTCKDAITDGVFIV